MPKQPTTDSYQTVTDQIINALDNGVLPWCRPWNTVLPQSIRGHVYRGINLFILGMQPYGDPRWLTFNKARELGGTVRKGEKSVVAYFWNWVKSDATNPDSKEIPLLKVYRVFNVEQCDSLDVQPFSADQCDGTPIDRAEKVIANLPWPLRIKTGNAAYWMPSDPDSVTMPAAKSFRSMDAYYSTLFHELAHATGASSRLNRDMSGHFGDSAYGFEELVAQFTAAFVCAHVGIDNTTNADAAYIQGWAKALRNDRRMIFRAATSAQRAADYILQVPREAETAA
jgi:antirestriction protein ArdC